MSCSDNFCTRAPQVQPPIRCKAPKSSEKFHPALACVLISAAGFSWPQKLTGYPAGAFARLWDCYPRASSRVPTQSEKPSPIGFRLEGFFRETSFKKGFWVEGLKFKAHCRVDGRVLLARPAAPDSGRP